MRRGGEHGHVTPISATSSWAEPLSDAGDLIEPGRRRGERGDQLVDPGVQDGDVAVRASMRRAWPRRGRRGGRRSSPVNASRSWGACPASGRGRIASTSGSRCPAIIASSILRPDTPCRSEITDVSLICASSRSFSSRCFSRVWSRTSAAPVAGEVPQPPDRLGVHQAGPAHAPLGDLGQPHRVEFVGLRPAGDVLDMPALSSQHSKPCGLQQVEHRFPVAGGRLHRHQFHLLAAQPVRQPQQPGVTVAYSRTSCTRRPASPVRTRTHATGRPCRYRSRTPAQPARAGSS